MVPMVIFLSSAFLLSIIICEPAQWVTNNFEQCGDVLEECDWYLLPIELQRLYLIFLLDAQQPVHIQCYGGVVCSRETFKKVPLSI